MRSPAPRRLADRPFTLFRRVSGAEVAAVRRPDGEERALEDADSDREDPGRRRLSSDPLGLCRRRPERIRPDTLRIISLGAIQVAIRLISRSDPAPPRPSDPLRSAGMMGGPPGPFGPPGMMGPGGPPGPMGGPPPNHMMGNYGGPPAMGPPPNAQSMVSRLLPATRLPSSSVHDSLNFAAGTGALGGGQVGRGEELLLSRQNARDHVDETPGGPALQGHHAERSGGHGSGPDGKRPDESERPRRGSERARRSQRASRGSQRQRGSGRVQRPDEPRRASGTRGPRRASGGTDRAAGDADVADGTQRQLRRRQPTPERSESERRNPRDGTKIRRCAFRLVF